MAKNKDIFIGIPYDTIVDVVAIKDGSKPIVKSMTYEKFLNIKKIKSWNYKCYQVGFYQNKLE